MPEPSPARTTGLKGTINVRVSEKITLENLHSIINHIVGINGCQTCGLLGVDLVFERRPARIAASREASGCHLR